MGAPGVRRRSDCRQVKHEVSQYDAREFLDAAGGEAVRDGGVEARLHDANAQIAAVDLGLGAFVGVLHSRVFQFVAAMKPVTSRP